MLSHVGIYRGYVKVHRYMLGYDVVFWVCVVLVCLDIFWYVWVCLGIFDYVDVWLGMLEEILCHCGFFV